MKIGLFGGSFNPIHNGHLAVIGKVLDVVDEVWVIPCKKHSFGKELAKAKDRLAMTKIAVAGDDRIKVLDIELRREGVSYTADTVRELKNKFSFDFYWIIGCDSLGDLEKWFDYRYLKENVKFIVVKRPSYDFSVPEGMEIVKLNNEISSSEIRDKLSKGLGVGGLVPESVFTYLINRRLYQNEFCKSCGLC